MNFDKNAPYAFVAYAIFMSGMLVYALSLMARARAARRDEVALDGFEADDRAASSGVDASALASESMEKPR